MPLIRKAFKRLHRYRAVCSLVSGLLTEFTQLKEMMAERGIIVDHSSLHRWVIRLVPLIDKAFRRHKHAVGCHLRVDETYIKFRGHWKYLYLAVDTAAQTIDFLLTARRDADTALLSQGHPSPPRT